MDEKCSELKDLSDKPPSLSVAAPLMPMISHSTFAFYGESGGKFTT